MGLLDDAKSKLSQAVGEHGDKIKQGLEKAGDFVDEKTGGKYSDKIEKGKEAAERALDKVEAQGEHDGATEGAAPVSDGHYEPVSTEPPEPEPEPDAPADGPPPTS